MIAVGGGLYLAYTPYNAMLFDRLIAAGGTVGNAGFLIYVADACGYVGSVALVLVRSLAGLHLDWAEFLARTSLFTGLCGLGLLAAAARYFHRRLVPTQTS